MVICKFSKNELFLRILCHHLKSRHLCYIKLYFPNAVSVVDSFHVMQWLIHSLDMFLRSLQKEYKARDESMKQIYYSTYGYQKRTRISDEVYL